MCYNAHMKKAKTPPPDDTPPIMEAEKVLDSSETIEAPARRIISRRAWHYWLIGAIVIIIILLVGTWWSTYIVTRTQLAPATQAPLENLGDKEAGSTAVINDNFGKPRREITIETLEDDSY